MFARLVGESFARNPRRKILTAAALVVGIAVATATLTVALEVGDRLALEFRSLGANLIVTPQSDTLPVEIGGVDYRPVDEGAYLKEADLGKLKTIFWRHNILGFTPFLDIPAQIVPQSGAKPFAATLIGTWYEHDVPVPDGTTFKTGVGVTHPWWKIRGKWFRENENECVVGEAFARTYPGSISIGQTIFLKSTAPAVAKDSFMVGKPIPGGGYSLSTKTAPESSALHTAGAIAEKISTMRVVGIVSTGDAEDQAVFVTLSFAQGISAHLGKFRQLFVSALTKPADALAERDPATLTPTEYDRWFCSPYISSISFQITTVLPGTNVRAIRRVAETEGRVLTRVSTLLWIVTLAALIAACLAVAATSATTVIERRAEIGIMKAIGATNALVASLFLVEQLMLAIVGGSIGFVFGVGLARVLGESVFGSPAPPRVVLLPIVLGLAAIVAIVGSLVPLRRAAHLNPAPVLRGE
jgi:putative ABC transport system permease protein